MRSTAAWDLAGKPAGRGWLPKDRHELFPDAVVAEGVLDRLINSFRVHVEGASYRPKRRPGWAPTLAQGGWDRVEEPQEIGWGTA